MGLVQQASSMAAVFGPVLLAGWVEHVGWNRVSLLYLGIGLLGFVAARGLRRLEAHATRQKLPRTH
jgi:MFS family permease